MSARGPRPVRRGAAGRGPLAVALFSLVWRLNRRPFARRYEKEAVDLFRSQLARVRATGSTSDLVRYQARALLEAALAIVRPGPPSRRVVSPGVHGGASGMPFLLDDLGQAARSLRAARAYTLTVVATLALGVGGSVAVFSLLNGVLLRPLPYPEPERLAILWTWDLARDMRDGSSYDDVADWRDRSRSFTDLALYLRPEFAYATLTGRGLPRRVRSLPITPSLLPVLGVEPALGRNFTPEEELGGAPAVLISDTFWRTELGADPAVLDTALELDGERMEIVGVMPAGFEYPTADTVAWTLHSRSTGWPNQTMGRGYDGWVVLGRLAPGVDFEVAQEELAGVARQLESEHPETNTGKGVRVRPLLEEVTGPTLPRALWLLFGAVSLVLLIAATNVAHLTLARNASREPELALRAAIGAGGGRLARHLFTEAVLLSLVAGAAGLAVGAGLLRVLLDLAPASLPRLDQIGLEPGLFGGAFAATVVLGLGASLRPALAAARTDPAGRLREGRRGSDGSGRRRLRSALVVTEVTLAMVLLAGAGLFLRSFAAARGEQPGYAVEELAIAQVDLPADKYPERADATAFYEQLVTRLGADRELRDATAAGGFFIDGRNPDMTLTREGLEGTEPPQFAATSDAVLPGFLRAIGVPLLAGRALEPLDLEATDDRPAVINETAARLYWPDEDPIGQRFRWGIDPPADRPYLRVVGVVGDMRRLSLDAPPVAQFFTAGAWWQAQVLVASDDPERSLGILQRTVAEMDPVVPISRASAVAEHYGAALAQRRFQSTLLGFFSLLAVGLAAAGLVGMIHESVARRRREMGIRLALGAEPGSLLRLVLRQALALTVAGVALGLVVSIALSRATASLLYGVAPTDLATLTLAAALLTGIGLAASLRPARRATRTPPAESLSAE